MICVLFYTISCFFRESAYGQSIDIINTEQKTYYYTNDWRDTIVDSSQFHTRSGHENPKEFPIKNRIQIANHVLVGGYELGEAAKDEINNYIEITSDTRPEDPAIKLHSGIYYHCNDVFNPEIGDIRLQFLTAGIEGNFVRITRNAHKHNSCGTHLSVFHLFQYTIVAKYENNVLVPYVTSINTTVLILLPGRHTLNEAFEAAHYERKLHAWVNIILMLIEIFECVILKRTTFFYRRCASSDWFCYSSRSHVYRIS